MFDRINLLSPCRDVTSVGHSENVILCRKGETSSSHSLFVFLWCYLFYLPTLNPSSKCVLAEMRPAMQPPCGAQL